jgi:hypothetical protein
MSCTSIKIYQIGYQKFFDRGSVSIDNCIQRTIGTIVNDCIFFMRKSSHVFDFQIIDLIFD